MESVNESLLSRELLPKELHRMKLQKCCKYGHLSIKRLLIGGIPEVTLISFKHLQFDYFSEKLIKHRVEEMSTGLKLVDTRL